MAADQENLTKSSQDQWEADTHATALVRLSDLFEEAETLGDFSYAAGQILGETLSSSRVGYGTIDPVADTLFVERDWINKGVDSLKGVTPLRDYGSFIESLKLGEFIAIADTSLDPRTEGAVDALASRATRAFLNVPVMENGELVAVLFVNAPEPREWNPAQISFVKEVARRTRTAVERSRSETALKQSERHLRLMVMELNHRVKNSLAVIQSIASQTLRGSPEIDTARKAFTARIHALAVAHDVLTNEQWDGLKLADVMHGVLDALRGAGDRITIGGPEVILTPQVGLTLSLALHELGTNAMKYGALSNDGGRVDVTWSIMPHDPECVSIVWKESGGPAVVAPANRGFGSRLLEKALASELNGRVTIHFEPAGVRCEIVGRMRTVEET